MILQVVIDERAQRRDAAPAHRVMHRESNNVASVHAATANATERESALVAVAAPESAASAVGAADGLGAPRGAFQSESVESGVADVSTTEEGPVADGVVDSRAADATRNGYPQAPAGLHQFLADGSFTDSVKDVAAILIDEPHLRQTQVARRLHVDKSTVSRRWRLFVTAAEAEGFAVPPLPAAESAGPVRELQPA